MLEYFNSTHGRAKAWPTPRSRRRTPGISPVVSSMWRRTASSLSSIAAPHAASKCAPSSTPARSWRRLARGLWPHRGRGCARTVGHRSAGSQRFVARGNARRTPGHRRRAGDRDSLRADVRNDERLLRQVLRARSRPRHAGQYGRGGRRDRRAINRRAGHAAHHAYVHIGGAAQISEQSFIKSNFEGTVKIKNLNVARNSDGDMIAMGRNLIVAVTDHGRHRARRAPYPVRRAAEGRGR